MPTYLTTAEAAARLDLNPGMVQSLCRKGRFPGAHKDPRTGNWLIPESALASFQASLSSPLPTKTSSAGERLGDHAGDQFKLGNISRSNVAIGRQSQVIVNSGASAEDLARLFESVYERIQARPLDPDVDKGEIEATVQNIEAEAVKGQDANPSKLQRWLKTLADIAPDILDVVLAALLSPTGAIATVIRKVAERAKGELAK
jgi:hypothetical protein